MFIKKLNFLILLMISLLLSGCAGGWVGGSYGFGYETHSQKRVLVPTPNDPDHHVRRFKKRSHTEHVFSQNWGNWGSGGYETHETHEKVALDPIERKTIKHKSRITYPD